MREALAISDTIGLADTGIALNMALVTLDGVGEANEDTEISACR